MEGEGYPLAQPGSMGEYSGSGHKHTISLNFLRNTPAKDKYSTTEI